MRSEPTISAMQRAEAVAFVERVLFLPYRADAAGPDAVDCKGLFRWAQRALFGREVAAALVAPQGLRAIVRAIPAAVAASGWREVAEPQHGDAVVMSQSSDPHHIGTWLDLDGGAVLHCVEMGGVLFEDRAALKAAGWLGITFYRAPDSEADNG